MIFFHTNQDILLVLATDLIVAIFNFVISNSGDSELPYIEH